MRRVCANQNISCMLLCAMQSCCADTEPTVTFRTHSPPTKLRVKRVVITKLDKKQFAFETLVVNPLVIQ
jgi:hypothetical protein